MLEVTDLHVSYGAVRAVRGVTLRALPGQVSLVLGTNGAGKTTTMRAVSGFLSNVEGSVRVNEEEILGKAPHVIVNHGMVLVPEGRKIFAPLSVEENLLLGGYRTPKREAEEIMAQVYERFPILEERRNGAAGLLSGGEQQMLAFGRALMSDPKVVLMDEPSMGLAPTMVKTVMDSARAIADSGVAVLMVEQNADAAMKIADDVTIIDRGSAEWLGAAADISVSELHARLGGAFFEN